MIMLEDAVKGVSSDLQLLDVAEIIAARLEK